MAEAYIPSSDFLKAVAVGDVPLSGSEFADTNLARLIALCRDEELSNRDWAVFLLSAEAIDTAEIRAGLLQAVRDVNAIVRAEAILGLARRDPTLALPLVQAALREDTICLPIVEAAQMIADPTLSAGLRKFMMPSDDEWLDRAVAQALAACEGGGR